MFPYAWNTANRDGDFASHCLLREIRFLRAPRRLIAAKHICRQMSAYARSPAAQTIHKILLRRKSQNPQFLLNFRSEATIQAAITVTPIAGHCKSSIGFISLLKMCPLEDGIQGFSHGRSFLQNHSAGPRFVKSSGISTS